MTTWKLRPADLFIPTDTWNAFRPDGVALLLLPPHQRTARAWSLQVDFEPEGVDTGNVVPILLGWLPGIGGPREAQNRANSVMGLPSASMRELTKSLSANGFVRYSDDTGRMWWEHPKWPNDDYRRNPRGPVHLIPRNNPSYSQLSDDDLIDIYAREKRGSPRRALAALKKRGWKAKDLDEMISTKAHQDWVGSDDWHYRVGRHLD